MTAFPLQSPSETDLKFISFFAGIGGFDLGFEKAGLTPALHCEINTYCNSILEKHWPNVAKQSDIQEVDVKSLPEAQVWCGGFPCQDVSVARGWLGRDGLKGKNSGLFYPFYNLISQKEPEVVILENVTGLLNSHNGQDFRILVQSLTSSGYGVAWRVLNTRYFGAPQSRPRVYICAWKGSATSALRVLYQKQNSPRLTNIRSGFITPSPINNANVFVPQTAYCLAATSGRHTGTDWSRSYIAYYDQVRRLTPSECERLQGFPTNWTIPKNGDFGSKDEIDTLRYHALGNAVSVPVVEWIASRVKNELLISGSLQDEQYEFKSLIDIFEHFSNANQSQISAHQSSSQKIKWGTGGCALNDDVIEASVSPAPSPITPSMFIDVVEQGAVDRKYFLSPNAAEGIIRRVTSQNRTLFQPLYDALVRLSKNK